MTTEEDAHLRARDLEAAEDYQRTHGRPYAKLSDAELLRLWTKLMVAAGEGDEDTDATHAVYTEAQLRQLDLLPAFAEACAGFDDDAWATSIEVAQFNAQFVIVHAERMIARAEALGLDKVVDEMRARLRELRASLALLTPKPSEQV
jgi:hypothetical protein